MTNIIVSAVIILALAALLICVTKVGPDGDVIVAYNTQLRAAVSAVLFAILALSVKIFVPDFVEAILNIDNLADAEMQTIIVMIVDMLTPLLIFIGECLTIFNIRKHLK